MFLAYRKNFETLDLMVNNAGITKFQPFLETTEALFDEVIDTNFKGAYFCGQAAARLMVEAETKGVIINITSIHATFNLPIHNIYAPGKAALAKLTKHEALELARYGIRVNAVAPGCICNTPEIRGNARQQHMASRIPLHRVGECEDIADAVLFLASDSASYITGVQIDVEGGLLLPAMADYDV